MRILCVHQGFELYGSDKGFIQAVSVLRRTFPAAEITALVPRDGPIVAPLSKLCDVKVEQLLVMRRREVFRAVTIDAFRTLSAVVRAHKQISRSDLVYVNTCVIADYLVAARWFAGRVICHVREIPTGMARLILRPLVRFSRASLIFNSRETSRSFSPEWTSQSVVIHNSFMTPDAILVPPQTDETRLLMLGRINAWKGQDLLVEAIAKLSETERKHLRVRIVGGEFYEGNNLTDALVQRVESLGLSKIVTVEPFTENVADLYNWANVAAVPSRLPEPFGRVAIEAMAYARPVIASAHGGLLEIVEDHVTGLLCEPNDSDKLADAVRVFIHDPAKKSEYGQAGRQAFLTRFTNEKIEETMKKFFLEYVDREKSSAARS